MEEEAYAQVSTCQMHLHTLPVSHTMYILHTLWQILMYTNSEAKTTVNNTSTAIQYAPGLQILFVLLKGNA